MNIYFEPINLNVWDMFSKVKRNKHIETFIATKEMNIGDILLLYVGGQKNDVESGVYAIARITSNVFVLRENPDDYCNNRSTVEAEIIDISYKEPIISNDICKQIFKQFRSVHRIKEISRIDLSMSFILTSQENFHESKCLQ